MCQLNRAAVSAGGFRIGVAVVTAFLAFTGGGSPVHAADLTVSVVDSASGAPLASRVYVEHRESRELLFVRALSTTEAIIYRKQNWANPKSLEHHTCVPAAPFIAENLRPGTYEITVERGKEYFPEVRQVVIAEGDPPMLTIPLRRWVNLASRGWYSGETHLHRSLRELPVILQAEDLNVAMPLTYWVTKAFTPPSQGDKNQTGDVPDQLIEVDRTHVIWPRNTEYEIFSVGEHRHTLGALFVLNHRSVLKAGAPLWKPIAETARAEGALLDMDKLDWPFGMTLPHISRATLYELANNHLWRTEFGLKDWVTEAPSFLQPPAGGKGGDERDWLNYTLGQYYTLLNAGFRLTPTAGTASGVHPVPAGFSRVYVQLTGEFSYEKWLSGLQQGRSFVTTGPILLATLDQQPPGATLTAGGVQNRPLRLAATFLSEHPLEAIEVVQNGRVRPAAAASSTQTSEGAWSTDVAVDVPCAESGWICLRCTEARPDRRLRFAHSAPWWVTVPEKPLRLARHEKEYLIRRVQDEIARSSGILPESAIDEYKDALRHFDAMPVADDEAAGTSAPK
jgi:hypothetical protein